MQYGMFCWQIKNLPPPAQLVKICHDYHISKVCVKIQNGLNRYNQVGQDGKWTGNDDYFKGSWIATLEAGDIEVHGWAFLYTLPTSPGAQAGISGERVQKLGIRSLKLDIEEDGGGGWKTSPYRKQSAVTYMTQVRGAGVPLSYPLGMCSYRRPDLHPQVPWTQFLLTEDLDHNAQQCYWAGAHNPGEQVLKSVLEYDEIRVLPQEPVGAMYGEGGWAPTKEDITEFMVTARDRLSIGTVWFWSLDYVVAYNWWHLLEAASDVVSPPGPAPITSTMWFEVRADALPYLNVREYPGGPDAGNLYPGDVIEVSNVAGVDAWAQIASGPFTGKYACIKKSVRYLDPTEVP